MDFDLDSLSSAVKNDVRYPPQMQWVDRGIKGQGFYPGAEICTFNGSPAGGIMLLGRDFGTLDYYQRLANEPGRSEWALTWRHTRDIYLTELTNIPIWCTNYLMGVRKDGSSKGDVSSRMSQQEWDSFEESCWGLLEKQISLQSPKVIVVFGDDNQRDLNRKTRLGTLRSSCLSIVYSKHPHSAIGERNQIVHRQQCATIRSLWLKQFA